MHILFLTTANLPTNPRLLKEIDLAAARHQVSVVLWRLGNWSDAINEQMMLERPDVNFVVLDATHKSLLKWIMWAVAEKLSRLLYPVFKNKLFMNALAHTRRSIQLLQTIKHLPLPDLIVAHNLGALYPAYQSSKNNKRPFIYDIEDYDPGIEVQHAGKYYKQWTAFILKRCAPNATALTAASPLIGDYTLQLIGGHPNHQVVLNSFPAEEFKQLIPNDLSTSPPNDLNPSFPISQTLYPNSYELIANSSGALRLVWFSQKISFGRGLEQLLEALSSFTNNHSPLTIQLTLIGDLDPAFDRQIITPFTIHHSPFTIHHIPPLSQPALHAELAKHDVGLALEFNTTDLNRQLCLTNKIIAYAQAGLYILATDTPAQAQFMQQHPGIGTVCGQDKKGMLNGLICLLEASKTINEEKQQRFENGKELAWEKESYKIETLWSEFNN